MNKLIAVLIMTFGFQTWAVDSVVSVDENGNDHTYSLSELASTYGGTFDESAFKQFQLYSDKTGGTFGFCPQYSHLPKVMNQIFDAIIAQNATQNDVALVLDVTGSMGDEIDAVKENLVALIERFQVEAPKKDVRLALVIYRDAGDEFVTQVAQNFTTDLQTLSQHVKTITVGGGGDTPEAVLDAVETAGLQLPWRQTAAKNMIIIGDAPGHEKSTSTGKDLDGVLAELALKSSFIIHPLLVANISGPIPSGFGSF